MKKLLPCCVAAALLLFSTACSYLDKSLETGNWLIGEILAISGSLLWNVLSSCVLCVFLGLVAGILLVVWLNKRKLFNRPTRSWTALAKINMALIPIMFVMLGGCIGFTYGAHKTIDGWITDSTKSLEGYAAGYLPTIQKVGQQMIESKEKTEDQLYTTITAGSGFSENSYAQEFYYWINKNIITYLLHTLGYSGDVTGLERLVKEKDVSKMSAGTFNGFATALRGQSGGFFMPIYTSILLFFLPFLLVPVGEYGFYFLKENVFSKKPPEKRAP